MLFRSLNAGTDYGPGGDFAPTPYSSEELQRIIDRLQPDVLVKGADWPEDRIIGRETVEARGGRVIRIPLAEGYSTSAIIKKIQGL